MRTCQKYSFARLSMHPAEPLRVLVFFESCNEGPLSAVFPFCVCTSNCRSSPAHHCYDVLQYSHARLNSVQKFIILCLTLHTPRCQMSNISLMWSVFELPCAIFCQEHHEFTHDLQNGLNHIRHPRARQISWIFASCET